MNTYKQIFQNELNNIEKNGLLKRERALKTPQGTEIITENHMMNKFWIFHPSKVP